MLRFVEKKDVWDLCDAGYDEDLEETKAWGLKSAQDLMAYSLLRKLKGKDIAEVGGGRSRILKALAASNTCCNIEKFEGLNNGPRKEIVIEGVENISAYVGDSHGVVDPATFDVVFSISVVEHLDIDALPAFFKDCARILRPGGLIVHLIDMYLDDDAQSDPGRIARYSAYLEPFKAGVFEPLDVSQVRGLDCLKFSCAYISHPDQEMYKRNTLAPRLKHLRYSSQSCAVVMAGRAPTFRMV